MKSRRVITKQWLLIVAAIVLAAKLFLPNAAKRVGLFISGAPDNRMNRAMLCFCESIGGGDSLSDAVEVFRDALQQAPED